MTVLEKVQDIVKAASDKTSEVIEVSRIKASISEDLRAMNELKAKLGDIYYNVYQEGEVLTPEATEICLQLEKCIATMAEKEEQLTKIREARAAKAKAAQSEEPAVCPECGSENPSGAKFCNDCGAKIPVVVEAEATEVEEEPVKRVCSACGAEIVPGKKFCNECGAKVEE